MKNYLSGMAAGAMGLATTVLGVSACENPLQMQRTRQEQEAKLVAPQNLHYELDERIQRVCRGDQTCIDSTKKTVMGEFKICQDEGNQRVPSDCPTQENLNRKMGVTERNGHYGVLDTGNSETLEGFELYCARKRAEIMGRCAKDANKVLKETPRQ